MKMQLIENEEPIEVTEILKMPAEIRVVKKIIAGKEYRVSYERHWYVDEFGNRFYRDKEAWREFHGTL